MNLADLTKEIEGEATKEETMEALKSLGFRTADEVLEERKGVDTKNKQLLKEKKELQDKVNALDGASDSIKKAIHILHDNNLGVDDPENVDYDKVQKAIDTLRTAGGDSGNGNADAAALQEAERKLKELQRNLSTTERNANQFQDTINELTAQRDGLNNEINSGLIDSAFNSALSKAGYSAEVVDMILPALRVKSSAQVQLNEETGERSAVVDDGGDIPTFIDLWKDSDQGKALRMAPVNHGGGAGGGAGGKFDTHKAWKDYSAQERTDLHKRNPEAYRKLRDAAGIR